MAFHFVVLPDTDAYFLQLIIVSFKVFMCENIGYRHIQMLALKAMNFCQ